MHVLLQGTVFYIRVLGISPARVCAACALRVSGLRGRRFPCTFSILCVCKALHQARGVGEHPCCGSASAGLPISLSKGKRGNNHTAELRVLLVSRWVLKDEQVSDTGSCQLNADSDTFPRPHHNEKPFFGLVLGFLGGFVLPPTQPADPDPKHLQPGKLVAESDAPSYNR